MKEKRFMEEMEHFNGNEFGVVFFRPDWKTALPDTVKFLEEVTGEDITTLVDTPAGEIVLDPEEWYTTATGGYSLRKEAVRQICRLSGRAKDNAFLLLMVIFMNVGYEQWLSKALDLWLQGCSRDWVEGFWTGSNHFHNWKTACSELESFMEEMYFDFFCEGECYL